MFMKLQWNSKGLTSALVYCSQGCDIACTLSSI